MQKQKHIYCYKIKSSKENIQFVFLLHYGNKNCSEIMQTASQKKKKP